MFKSHPTTQAPSLANTKAASRPMLPPVPVMMHTFPDSLAGIIPSPFVARPSWALIALVSPRSTLRQRLGSSLGACDCCADVANYADLRQQDGRGGITVEKLDLAVLHLEEV